MRIGVLPACDDDDDDSNDSDDSTNNVISFHEKAKIRGWSRQASGTTVTNDVVALAYAGPEKVAEGLHCILIGGTCTKFSKGIWTSINDVYGRSFESAEYGEDCIRRNVGE